MLKILGTIFLVTIRCVNSFPSFDQFLDKYNKFYSNDEYITRKQIYNKNLDNIKKHNTQHYNFNLTINEFADKYAREISKGYFKPYNTNFGITNGCNKFNSNYLINNLPYSVDWRDKNAVTNVKNQGQCGSCWSFSAVGAMEGSWAIATGKLLNLSEQQLMDCSDKYGNMACNGGIMDHGFDYAIDNGMCSYKEDPYQGKSDSCNINCKKVAFFSECVDISSGNQLDLKAAVAQQPVSIAIEADTSVFQFYSGGVLDSYKCGTDLDHGVLIVGYGNEKGIDYWLVKNSWGSSWGDNGYIKIKRSNSTDDIGICGIASSPSYPVSKIKSDKYLSE
jgi:hypothetical protein